MTPVEPVRRILHCDMDCFYAAVHMRDDPALLGKPVVIGGRPESRGVVAAASYEVRQFGVRSAMPSSRAVRLCPQAIFIRPDFPRYREESKKIFAIFDQFTPLVQPMSIDEAYLDVTDHLGDFGSATGVAKAIRRQVREERDLAVSIGVAPNRLVAKIASDFNKPDGLTVVKPERVSEFMASLPVRRLHGVGPATEKALAELGVVSISDLRSIPVETLEGRFGVYGRALARYAHGIDDRPVVTTRERKSLSKETTFARDLTRIEEMEKVLDDLAESVARGLVKRDLVACTVTIKVRYEDFTTVTRSRSRQMPFSEAEEICAVARELLHATEAPQRPVRLLGVGAAKLIEGGPDQLQLFS